MEVLLSFVLLWGMFLGYFKFLKRTHEKNLVGLVSKILFLFGVFYGIYVGDFYGTKETNIFNLENVACSQNTIFHEKGATSINIFFAYLGLAISCFLHGLLVSPYSLYVTVQYVLVSITINHFAKKLTQSEETKTNKR